MAKGGVGGSLTLRSLLGGIKAHATVIDLQFGAVVAIGALQSARRIRCSSNSSSSIDIGNGNFAAPKGHVICAARWLHPLLRRCVSSINQSIN